MCIDVVPLLVFCSSLMFLHAVSLTPPAHRDSGHNSFLIFVNNAMTDNYILLAFTLIVQMLSNVLIFAPLAV